MTDTERTPWSYDADATWWKNRANRAAEQVDNLGLELSNERRRADLLEQARQGWEDRAHTAEATLARVQDLLDTYKRYPNRASPCIVADLTTALDGEVI